MEITIDVESVRQLTSQEYRQARADILELGPVKAYERSQQRHDERLAAAADAPTLACKAGCSWCCHFSVDVRPVEVFRILDAVAQFTPDELARVHAEIRANSEALSQFTPEQRAMRNIKCPFLSTVGRCTIYSARPQTCRNYHATNVAGCQQAFEDPDNIDIDPEFAPLVFQAGGAHVDAFSKAMDDEGYDVQAFELSTALAAAMLDPDATRERFESKRPPFAGLDGMEVPLEFIEEVS
jgi:Fe-S-cluster containining protein